ncbi:hypothetical protein NKH18_16710 [Streptomyces sp. M10(2022)]
MRDCRPTGPSAPRTPRSRRTARRAGGGSGRGGLRVWNIGSEKTGAWNTATAGRVSRRLLRVGSSTLPVNSGLPAAAVARRRCRPRGRPPRPLRSRRPAPRRQPREALAGLGDLLGDLGDGLVSRLVDLRAPAGAVACGTHGDGRAEPRSRVPQ